MKSLFCLLCQLFKVCLTLLTCNCQWKIKLVLKSFCFLLPCFCCIFFIVVYSFFSAPINKYNIIIASNWLHTKLCSLYHLFVAWEICFYQIHFKPNLLPNLFWQNLPKYTVDNAIELFSECNLCRYNWLRSKSGRRACNHTALMDRWLRGH